MRCHHCELERDRHVPAPGPACPQCGGPWDSVVALGQDALAVPKRIGHPCPLCVTRLVPADLNGLPVQICANCHGLLMGTLVFEVFVRSHRTEFRNAALQNRSVPHGSVSRRCPQCRRRLRTHPCRGPFQMLFQGCTDCCLVWITDHLTAQVPVETLSPCDVIPLSLSENPTVGCVTSEVVLNTFEEVDDILGVGSHFDGGLDLMPEVKGFHQP